jgi:hypothetical protein
MMDGKPWSREKEACAEKVVHQLLRTMPVGVFDAIASEGEEGGLNCTRVLDETPDIRTQAYLAESIPILVVSFNGFHTGMPAKYEGFQWSSETIAIQDGETRYTFYPVTVERLEGDALACVYYPTSPSRIGMYSVLQGSFICSRSLTDVEHFLSHPSKWNPGPPQ